MSNHVIKWRKLLFGGIFENNVGIIGQFCENNRLKFWEILKRIIGKIKRIIGSCLPAVSIWNSIGACQHYCRTAYSSRTAYWAQPTASQGYSIHSLLAAVLHHSWTASWTFGLYSHSTNCSWTASSSAAASVGGALCYFNVMWSCV